jgi:lipopolysaccharide export system protein LptA
MKSVFGRWPLLLLLVLLPTWGTAQSLAARAPQRMAAAPTPAPEEKVKIYADKAIYRKQEKTSRAIGHVKIIQDNTTIYADETVYNEDTKQSVVEDGVKIVQVAKTKEKGRTTTITSAKMTAYHQEKRLLLEQDVRLDRESYTTGATPTTFAETKPERRERTETAVKQARTVVTSDRMEYFTRTENADLEGNVVVLQKEKRMTGKRAFIRGPEEGDTITLEEEATVTQINGNWLIQEKIIRPDPQDDEQQRFIREKLTIQADKIILFRATDDLQAEGNVKIVQKVGGKERVAIGRQATYSDRQQLATLSGDVKIQRENGDWLTADKALFYTEKEAFEATGTGKEGDNGQVVSEFTIEDEDKPAPKPSLNPPLPDYDLDAHTPGQRLPKWLDKSGRGRAPNSPTPTPSPAPTGSRPPESRTPSSPSPTPSPKPSVPIPTPTPIASSFVID